MNPSVKCKTLLGNKNLDFSIYCLNSFIENSRTDIRLEIFGDGTLSMADMERLQRELKNSRVIPRADREKHVQTMLAPYARCLEFRNKYIYGHKLFDVMLFSTDNLLFIDSDVLFLKKFTLPEFSNVPVVMRDKHNAYSFRLSDLRQIPFSIFPKVNTGMLYFPRKRYDLNFIESLLENPLVEKGLYFSGWLEQTLWAFLAGKYRDIQYFHPRQIIMARQHIQLDAETVAIHLVSSYRYHFEALKNLEPAGGDYVQIKLKDTSSYLSYPAFAIDRLKKAVRRRVGI